MYQYRSRAFRPQPFYARSQARRVHPRRAAEPCPDALRVLVVGGGPAGLAFATSLHERMRDLARITVRDSRWTWKDGAVQWKDERDGVRRREQVVTLQSSVWDRLPDRVKVTMFPLGGYSEVWPLGGASPAEIGYPRNVRIRDVEDRLLRLARDQGLTLRPGAVRPGEIALERWDVVAICDGPRSETRQHFVGLFGKGDPAPYSVAGQQLEETVLGLRVRTAMTAPSSVILTIAQNRFLMNVHDGEGYLYMRLTPEEAEEAQGQGPEGRLPCSQARPCGVGTVSSGRSPAFGPALDPASRLWPRVLDGLRLFDVAPEAVISATTFRLSMADRARFTACLSADDAPRPAFGVLLGDAANEVHFWPGRGMNHGLASALALVDALAACDPAEPLRAADLTGYEAAMTDLQRRHKDRAWRSMVRVQDDASGPLRGVEPAVPAQPIVDLIARAIACPAHERVALLARMRGRVEALCTRIDPRLPARSCTAELGRLLARVSDETLAVLVESGAWPIGHPGAIHLAAAAPLPSAT